MPQQLSFAGTNKHTVSTILDACSGCILLRCTRSSYGVLCAILRGIVCSRAWIKIRACGLPTRARHYCYHDLGPLRERLPLRLLWISHERSLDPIASVSLWIVPGRIPALRSSQDNSIVPSSFGKDGQRNERENSIRMITTFATMGEIEFCSWRLAELAGVDHRKSDLGTKNSPPCH